MDKKKMKASNMQHDMPMSMMKAAAKMKKKHGKKAKMEKMLQKIAKAKGY